MKVIGASYLAEYLGAFLLILSIFASGGNPLIIGATLAIIIFLVGGVSGAYVNPAVAVAMLMNGELKPIEIFGYVFAQLLGGVSAYYAYTITK